MTSSSFRNRMNRAAHGGVLRALLILGTSYAALGCSESGAGGQPVAPAARKPASPSSSGVGSTMGGGSVEATPPGKASAPAPVGGTAVEGMPAAVEGTPDVALDLSLIHI